ncbi:MAG: hypothetical protein Q9M37_02580 [Desulfonauticus sp.]|nr:hypothetical protein [Desulfonauticus sp.]
MITILTEIVTSLIEKFGHVVILEIISFLLSKKKEKTEQLYKIQEFEKFIELHEQILKKQFINIELKEKMAKLIEKKLQETISTNDTLTFKSFLESYYKLLTQT